MAEKKFFCEKKNLIFRVPRVWLKNKKNLPAESLRKYHKSHSFAGRKSENVKSTATAPPPPNCPLKSHSPSGTGHHFMREVLGLAREVVFRNPGSCPGGASGLRSRVTLRAGNSHLINVVKTGLQNRPFWTAVFSPKAFTLDSETLTPRGWVLAPALGPIW